MPNQVFAAHGRDAPRLASFESGWRKIGDDKKFCANNAIAVVLVADALPRVVSVFGPRQEYGQCGKFGSRLHWFDSGTFVRSVCTFAYWLVAGQSSPPL